MINAAGIVHQTPEGHVLFVRRSSAGDYEGAWAFPGGKIEDGETAYDAALRETEEEIGGVPPGTDLKHVLTTVDDDVNFTTYHRHVGERFRPTLNDEHSAWRWAKPDAAPKPLHPGAEKALERLSMNETDVARAIRDGRFPSPQRFENVWLFAIRITGTGMAYRKSLKEFVERDPKFYLNDEFLERCQGLPVIWEHPPKSILNSEEFAKRVVGTITIPYIQDDEVWGIAKIYDEKAAEEMAANRLSTSPAVAFTDPTVNDKVKIGDGRTLLVEGRPPLLDHVAICDQGVWDKSGTPTGVENATLSDERADSMTENTGTATAAEEGRADADAGKMLDKLLACVDSIASRMDAFEEREGKREDSRRADEFPPEAKKEGEEEEKKADEADGPTVEEEAAKEGESVEEEKKEQAEGETTEVAADKRKDAEKVGEEVKMDRADAKVLGRLANVLDRLVTRFDAFEAKHRPLPEADRDALVAEQVRADAAYQAFGQRAPAAMPGETVGRYAVRLARGMQKHSKRWAKVDLARISVDPTAFDVVKTDIYADAIAASSTPDDLKPGQLREIVKVNPSTGQRMSTFVGRGTYISQFRAPSRRVVGINTRIGA